MEVDGHLPRFPTGQAQRMKDAYTMCLPWTDWTDCQPAPWAAGLCLRVQSTLKTSGEPALGSE